MSYSHEDQVWVSQVATAAEAAGVEVYVDRHDAQPGTLLAPRLQQAISRSDALVVVLSRHSVRSSYVNQEIGYALRARKRVIPLVMPGIGHKHLGMLAGCEYIRIDPDGAEDATAMLRRALRQVHGERKEQQVINALLLVIIGLALVAASQGTRLPSS